MGKDLFLIWDESGDGSLTQEELLAAMVRIGLSQDHHFANKIMQTIKQKDKEEIFIKDFLKVFKEDEISEQAIKRIN
jgi:Ca2+-binding EF-hand superfamily protein